MIEQLHYASHHKEYSSYRETGSSKKFVQSCMYVHLLDISRQLACNWQLEKYQPIQYCWASCLCYPVHTCHLPIDIQQIYCSAQIGQQCSAQKLQIYCSAQTGQHERHRRECCPVWALQHICTVRTYIIPVMITSPMNAHAVQDIPSLCYSGMQRES